LPIGGISPGPSGGQSSGEVKVLSDSVSASNTSIPPITIPNKRKVKAADIARAQYNRS
tara:strand:+ start:1022 stop:1195 length:174 start_codon:yes stop_codon:yes gene_type:complete